VFVRAPALVTLQAPSGSPPDVCSRLLAICDVLDACEGLSVEAVIAAAERELKPSGSPGEHWLSGLQLETETLCVNLARVDASRWAFGCRGECAAKGSQVKGAGTC